MDESNPPPVRAAKGCIITGCFDGFHTGHLHILTESLKYGPLMVIIMSDEYIRKTKGREPNFTLKERFKMVADHLFVAATNSIECYLQEANDTKQVLNICNYIKPRYRVVGDDYKPEDVVKNPEAEVVVIPRIPGFSSSELTRQ